MPIYSYVCANVLRRWQVYTLYAADVYVNIKGVFMKAAISLSILLWAATPAWVHAQSQEGGLPPSTAAEATWSIQDRNAEPLQREGKTLRHIHHEDAGNSIDEIREGAETRSITVKPNNNMPSYNIMPDARNSQPGRYGSQNGQRVWRVMNF